MRVTSARKPGTVHCPCTVRSMNILDMKSCISLGVTTAGLFSVAGQEAERVNSRMDTKDPGLGITPKFKGRIISHQRSTITA